MEWIAGGRINEVGCEDNDDDNEWVDPGVTKGEIFPPSE